MNTDTTAEYLKKSPDEVRRIEDDFRIKKFRALCSEFFNLQLRFHIDPLQKIREISQFSSFSLPVNINEPFVRMEEAHTFWMLNTPLNSYIENFFKLHFSKSSASYELYKMAMNNYQKWIVLKTPYDKKISAEALVNLSEKISQNNFIYHLLAAAVYSTEITQLNFDKAEESLVKASEAVKASKVSESIRDDLLYRIELNSGFNHLKQNDIIGANTKFNAALKINPFGITAKFYLALTELKLNRLEVVYHLIREIISYDMFRGTHAVNEKHPEMLLHFITYPVIINVFYYEEFSLLFDFFAAEFNDVKNQHKENLKILREKTGKFHEIQLNEFYDDEFISIANLLIQVLTNPAFNNGSIFYYYLYPELLERLNFGITHLKENIRNRFNQQIQKELSSFNTDIEVKYQKIEQLKSELAEQIQKIKTKLKESIEKFEIYIADQISETESALKKINTIPRLSPSNAFSKSMAYNAVLSSLIFLMGGCAGYTNTFMYSVREVSDVMGLIVFSGIKWGGLSFLSGIVLSFLISAYIKMERANEKQKLLRYIAILKEKKETEVANLNLNFQSHEKAVVSNFEKQIQQENERIKNISELKEKKQSELTISAEEQIQTEFKKLDVLCG